MSEPDDTDMTTAEFERVLAEGEPVELVTSREEYKRRTAEAEQ